MKTFFCYDLHIKGLLVFFCKGWAPFLEIKQQWAPFLPGFSEIFPRFSRNLPGFSGLLPKFLRNKNFWGALAPPTSYTTGARHSCYCFTLCVLSSVRIVTELLSVTF